MGLIDGDENVLHRQAVNFCRKCIENKLGIDEILQEITIMSVHIFM